MGGKRTLRFGGRRFKAQVFNGDISVRFVSNKKKHGPGAICRATCNRAVPTTTTAAPTPPPSNETTTVSCGPSSCNISCTGGSQCVQNNSIQCFTSPCCPQWSCQSCPPERPDFGSSCDVSLEGVKCDYGKQTCCGETSAQIKMECDGSQWQGYYVDTICMFAGHTCSSSTTTTPSSCICPEIYQPVCSSSNQTFSNNCFAGCDKAKIACQVKDYFSFDFCLIFKKNLIFTTNEFRKDHLPCSLFIIRRIT